MKLMLMVFVVGEKLSSGWCDEESTIGFDRSIEKNPKLNHGEHFYWRAKAYDALGKSDLRLGWVIG